MLGTAPGLVSGVRSRAAARRWGAAPARGGRAARGGAQAPRGAQSPARPRSLQSPARSSRAAGREAGRSWRPRAGRRECHFLTRSPGDFHGLLRGPRVFSSASEGGRALLSASADAQERTRARAAGQRPGGERTARGLRGSSARRPLTCLQTALGTRKTSILSLSPALTPAFFSCLTNPRIIQLRKCWKEVS